jgi:hypothetical protein
VCLGPTKELIFMACYDRSHTPFGSSKLWTKSRKGRAMMSDDSKKKKKKNKRKEEELILN